MWSDAITRDKQPARSNERIADTASHNETQGQELEYAARISLDRMDMQVDEKRVKLSPGTAVTIEIKTGSRKNISYLLSPLAKYRRPPARTIESRVLLGSFLKALPILTRRHIANAVDHLPKHHTDLSAVITAHRSALSGH